jgi:hypothetical protein
VVAPTANGPRAEEIPVFKNATRNRMNSVDVHIWYLERQVGGFGPVDEPGAWGSLWSLGGAGADLK